MKIAELFARIGIKVDDDQAKRFDKNMKAAKTTLISISAVAVGTTMVLKNITSEAMASAVAFKQFETETGASAQSLQKWQAVAEQTNQSAESVTSAIKAITSNQEKIKLGQGNISGFQLLGIDPNQDPFEILESLREKTKGFTQAMKKNVLSQVGVGADLIQTLELSRDEFDKMAGNAFIISPQAIETLNQTKSSLDLVGRAFKFIKTQIAVELAPQITELTKTFMNFIKVNEKGIIAGFKKGYKMIKLFMGAISSTVKVINALIVNTIGWERSIKIAAVAFGVLNAVMAASPIGLITAGIILLIAVIDDLFAYSQGRDSLFGELMKKFPEMEQKMFGFIDKIIELKDLFKSFASGDTLSMDKILDDWGLLGNSIQFVYGKLTALKQFLDDNDVFGKIKEFAEKYDVIDKAVTGAKFTGKVVTNPLGAGVDMWSAIFDKFKEVTGIGMAPELAGAVGVQPANISNPSNPITPGIESRTNIQNDDNSKNTGDTNLDITQNIYGSSSPEQTGATAANLLKRQFNSASAQIGRTE